MQGGTAVDALVEVSLRVDRGEYVALVGPSGSGKSTLMQTIGGLDRAWTGEAVVLGQRLVTMDDAALSRFRRTQVGFTFQTWNLMPHLTALENVLLPAVLAGRGAEHRSRALELLARVGLDGRVTARPGELSGGQQQRVAIARALVMRAPLLLCDEPTGALDPATGREILTLIEESRQRDATTIIVVTHEAHVAERAPRQIVLAAGRIVADEVRRP